MLGQLEYIKMEIMLQAEEETYLPTYHGSMLRGIIGQTLRKVSCTASHKCEDCTKCKVFSLCPYANVFYCVNKDSSKLITNVETVPNPFVVYPLMNNITHFKKGDKFKFHLTIFGKAIVYINYFIFSICEIQNLGLGANRNKFKLIYIKDSEGGYILKDEIFHSDNIKIHKLEEKLEDCFAMSKEECTDMTFIFDTPLRMRKKYEFNGDIPFDILMKSILRRVAMAWEYFVKNEISFDYYKLIEEAKKIKISKINLNWRPLERYSYRAKRKLNIGGIVGSITFEGDLMKYLPYIKAGEVLHIGKGSTMGLGHYIIR